MLLFLANKYRALFLCLGCLQPYELDIVPTLEAQNANHLIS